jgi:hypothetical protein
LPETRTSKPNKKSSNIPVPLVVFACLLLVGGALAWYLNRGGQNTGKGPVLTAEAKAYVRNLQLSQVEMSAHESYLKQRVVQIVGKITNAGDRALQRVELNCVFYDPYGQVVLRERVPIVGGRTGGILPGQTKDFRLPFDNLPESWNQSMPQLVIAQITFN